MKNIKWTPDGCAMAVSWENGGIALWSTFGALLMCTLGWDYGLNVDLTTANPLLVLSMVSLISIIFWWPRSKFLGLR